MCRRAVPSEAEEVGGTGRGIGDVRLVVGAVEVYTVPAAEVSIRWTVLKRGYLHMHT
jgi:hypothetical protein